MKRIVSITEQLAAEMREERDELNALVPCGGDATKCPALAPVCLVVEDDENDAFLTSTALKAMGVEVTMADSGHKAVELLEGTEGRYDIAFVDLRLHGSMDGVELLRLLKSRFPKIHPVVVSGYMGSPELREFLNQGKDTLGYIGMISKPLEKMDVDEILQKHRLK